MSNTACLLLNNDELVCLETILRDKFYNGFDVEAESEVPELWSKIQREMDRMDRMDRMMDKQEE